ncbi:uncharacterized protein [Nicotiana sylvestris]|uniref:uncharacterized protein n=1 Tax=Nicotiana sylvestris TaxID=4096 RepID=UPI00388C5433
MVAKEMIRHDYKPRKGLGTSLQGITEPITLATSEKFCGVGFQAMPADKTWANELKNNIWVLPQPIPHLFRTFFRPNSNNAALNNMTCLRTSYPDPNMLSTCEIMNQEPEYDEEEAFRGVNRELEQFENKPKTNLNETEPVNLSSSEEVQETMISIHTDERTRDALIQLLFEFKDVFAWSYDDMLGLSVDLVVHKLPIYPDCPPVQQKVIPFGLKNAGSTYMRAITAIFHDMMHQEIELCAFGVLSGKLLGFIVSQRGIKLDPTKIKSIWDLPPPRTKKEVMSLLGRLNYISRFIAQLTSTCEPFFKMLKKDVAIKWMDECQEVFDKIKEYLSNPPVLVPPEPGRLAKWHILLTKFDIVYVTRTTKALADHLVENLVDNEYQPLSTYFPDEEVNFVEVTLEDTNAWKMFFDGVVKAKGIGIGAILISPTGQHYPATTRIWFFYINNSDEIEACIMGMNMEINQDVEELLIMGDSDLIIRQAQGELETRDIKLIPYRKHVENLSKWFKSVKFRYIPCFHNELANTLTTLASTLPYQDNLHIDPLEIQIRERHGYCNTVEVEPNVQPWYHDIKRFLKTKEYIDQANGDQKRTIRRLASGFFLSGEVLYKRTPNLNLLRYVDAEEAGRIMYEVHAGVCGPHMNGYILAKKIL